MNILLKYFPALSQSQKQQFQNLLPLYHEWNSRINVISRKDIEHLYLHHVLHSLSIAKIIQFAPKTSVVDVGTGGGFPGIPLAILFPEVDFLLVDSIKKKITVAQDVIDALNLKNAKATWTRAENVEGNFDFAVSRAVAEIKLLHTWVKDKISSDQKNSLPNGLLCLKGGNINSEIEDLNRKVKVFPIGDFFDEKFFKEKWIIHVSI